jgi:recombinase-like zinc beta ribbon protein
VPASGVERVVADAARAAVIDNVPVSAAGGGRVWQLLGGIMRCGGCGLRMQAHAVRRKDRTYHYVRCPLNQRVGSEKKCPVNARMPAEAAEEAVWRFVTRMMAEPDRMVEDMDALIEAERVLLRGDPKQEMRGLRGRLRDLDGRRERAQVAYLAGAFTVEERSCGRARASWRRRGRTCCGRWSTARAGARGCAS